MNTVYVSLKYVVCFISVSSFFLLVLLYNLFFYCIDYCIYNVSHFILDLLVHSIDKIQLLIVKIIGVSHPLEYSEDWLQTS